MTSFLMLNYCLQHFDISYINNSYKEQYEVRITWSDDFCEENSSNQIMVFP